MSYKLVILPEAGDDIFDCAMWYSENIASSGDLADDFLDAVDQTLKRLETSPLLHAIRHDDVRGIPIRRETSKGKSRRFPHLIFYRFRDPEILVIQVFPMKDDPDKIRY